MRSKSGVPGESIAIIGMAVARNPCRKTNTTIKTSTNASRSVCHTSVMFSRTYWVVS